MKTSYLSSNTTKWLCLKCRPPLSRSDPPSLKKPLSGCKSCPFALDKVSAASCSQNKPYWTNQKESHKLAQITLANHLRNYSYVTCTVATTDPWPTVDGTTDWTTGTVKISMGSTVRKYLGTYVRTVHTKAHMDYNKIWYAGYKSIWKNSKYVRA